MLVTRVRVSVLSGLALCAVVAVVMSIVAAFDLFIPAAMPRFGQPSPVVMRVPVAARMAGATRARLFDVSFEHRRVILDRGTVLRPDVEEHRAAVEFDAARRPPTAARMGSTFLLYFLGCVILSSYGVRFGHSRLRLMRSQVGLYAVIVGMFVVGKLMLLFTTLPAFWVPTAAVALWAALSFDRKAGLLIDMGAAFLTASLVSFDVMMLFALVSRGIVASLLFVNRKQPRQMIIAGLGAGLVAAVGYVSLSTVFQEQAGIVEDLALGWHSQILGCVGGGLLAGIVAHLGREPAEQLLGHVSRTRLLDLTDIESPLLRKMAAEAPGSWEHSRTMANLAEAAAASIGADSLLTRVGAYYHDLGKTVQPSYFIENLAHGETSPHGELEPEVSADAIMAHVVLGTKILRDGGVPEPVVEFAYTHHGTQVVEYFWNKYQERNADLDWTKRKTEAHFRYPGMKPMTKETAILMLVDSIEAASRTVEPPTHDKFVEMIRRIVFTKLSSGQLDDSGLTVVDLRIMIKRMASALVNMSHGRIKYPWQREKADERPAPIASEDEAGVGVNIKRVMRAS
ncbi:MAG: HDIG domain-containing protein [Deltaproteobacteria bacterium]|nr:HDIG domain-containing protein [Deltaproteobacteria bacterium]